GNGLLAQPLGLLLGRATGGLVGFTGSRLTSRQFGINGGNAVLRMALLLLHGQRLGIKVAGLGQAVLRVVRISRRDQVLIALLAVLPFALEPLTLGLGLGLGIEQAFDLLDAGLGMRLARLQLQGVLVVVQRHAPVLRRVRLVRARDQGSIAFI